MQSALAQMGVRGQGKEEEAWKKVIFLHTQASTCTHDLHNLVATGDAWLGAPGQVGVWISGTDKGQGKSGEEVG